MKIRRFVGAVGVVGISLGLALWACGSNRRQRPVDLAVTSYSPTEAIETASAIEIQFDRPVVDATAVGTAIDPSWITITPAVTWAGHWTDRQSLAIDPAGELAADTTYHVVLAGELAARTGGFKFQFVHQPLEVDGVFGIDTGSLAPDGAVPIAFNLPVRAKDAAAHCALVA